VQLWIATAHAWVFPPIHWVFLEGKKGKIGANFSNYLLHTLMIFPQGSPSFQRLLELEQLFPKWEIQILFFSDIYVLWAHLLTEKFCKKFNITNSNITIYFISQLINCHSSIEYIITLKQIYFTNYTEVPG
jgi:hypothetical protein